MKTNSLYAIGIPGLLTAAALLITLTASAQSFAPDPHDPQAYHATGHFKATGAKMPLLSTVHYITRADTLCGYDSSWITYDAGGHVSELLTFRWSAGQWIPFDRYVYHYNSSGLNDQTLYELWNLTKQVFAPLVRYNYAHDAGGNRTRLHYEVWNQVDGVFKNGLLEDYTLNAAGLRTAIIQQTWSITASAWDNNTIETISYNAQGQPLSYTIETWNTGTSTYIPKRQTLTSYDASGKIPVREESYNWNTITLSWEYKSRYTNTVSSGQISSRSNDAYDLVHSTWIPVSKETMSYMTTGELGSAILANWSGAAKTFQDLSRVTYSYTTDQQPKRLLTLMSVLGKWIVAEGAAETKYYYKGEKPAAQVGTATLPNSELRLIMAPVPASSVLELRLENARNDAYSFLVTDFSGRVLIHRQLTMTNGATSRIEVDALPAGTYSLTLRSSTGQRTSRVFSIVR